jgi:hypothetical protein
MIPSLFVHVPSRGKCWICGSPAKPSREHKFKASDIRRHFGKGDLYVGSSDDGYPSGKIAQGVDSTHLKFENPICERCNSSVTQESDSAYDRFIAQMEYDGPDVKEIYRIFSDPRFCKGPKLQIYIPLYRYFAKLLGCQLAEIGAPIPLHLSRFVAKKTDQNCIWLGVRRDVTYQQLASRISREELKYAAHGGLVIITKMPNLLPSRLYTTMTVGPTQFTFFFVLTALQILEMRLRYPKFITWCAETARRAIDDPIPPSKLEQLGLLAHKESDVER